MGYQGVETAGYGNLDVKGAASALQAAGLQVSGMHVGIDALRAAPRHLLCEADAYWVKVGGEDPAAFIRRQGQRIRLLHLKDEKELGTGPVDFPSVFAAIDAIGGV